MRDLLFRCREGLIVDVNRAGKVFAFAGLWDEWRSPDGEIIESCTILATGPNSLVADLYDRMPVIVTPDKYNVWLVAGQFGFFVS